MPEITDHSKPHDIIFGVMPCCGAPLVSPAQHHHWCKNYELDLGKKLSDAIDAVEKALEAKERHEPEIEPCPICGNEERGQGGHLTCECPSGGR